MIKDTARNMLNLIQANLGVSKHEVYDTSSIDVQKIIDIIISECDCSIIDRYGNYNEYGSNMDIRIVKNIVKLFLTQLDEIPPELVSMALTDGKVLGPFIPIKINIIENKKFEDIFPENFDLVFGKDKDIFQEQFVEEIIKPYVKVLIFSNEELMNVCPIEAKINKRLFKEKKLEELTNSYKKMLKDNFNYSTQQIDNTANYVLKNILQNKNFKETLIDNTLNAVEVQSLGKMHTSFSTLTISMINEVMLVLEEKDSPIEKLKELNKIYNQIQNQLKVLSLEIDHLSQNDFEEKIKEINTSFCGEEETGYREDEISQDEYGNIFDFVKVSDISVSLGNLYKEIVELYSAREEIGVETYIKETVRYHYRFLRIQPFKNENGKTARAIVNILLLGKNMSGCFEKEKRFEYIQSLKNADQIIESENFRMQYIYELSYDLERCRELEDKFLDKKLPFLLIKY